MEKYITLALAAVGALTLLLKAVAPLTKTTADDEALSWLGKVEAFMIKMLVSDKHLK